MPRDTRNFHLRLRRDWQEAAAAAPRLACWLRDAGFMPAEGSNGAPAPDWSDALGLARCALVMRPDDPGPRLAVFSCLFRRGSIAEAAGCLASLPPAGALAPRDRVALFAARALLLEYEGGAKEAAGLLRLCLALAPDELANGCDYLALTIASGDRVDVELAIGLLARRFPRRALRRAAAGFLCRPQAPACRAMARDRELREFVYRELRLPSLNLDPP